MSSQQPGARLENSLARLFMQLSPDQILALQQRVREEADRRNVVYFREEGKREVINILLRPRGIFPEQKSYFHRVSLRMLDALKKMPDIYLTNAAVRKIIPLNPDEERWLRETWSESHRQAHSIFGRFDATADFGIADWDLNVWFFRFMEPNLVGAGGIHYTPEVESIITELIVPELQKIDPTLRLEKNPDARDLLVREIVDHAEAIGRPGPTIGFMADVRGGESGAEEFERLVEYCRAQGFKAHYIDPLDLSVNDDEVCYKGVCVDVVYRDYELRELVALEREGHDLSAVKKLFKENRVVSSMGGDFDHKACWELFTDTHYAKYFTPGQRETFRRHLLWTRLVRDTMTRGPEPEEEEVSLLDFIRENRRELVLKPNRSYGGMDVMLGVEVDQSQWDAAIEKAIREPGSTVVQKLTELTTKKFPTITDAGEVKMEDYYAVCGFYATQRGLAILGRVSQIRVVNVAKKGGMCAVLVCPVEGWKGY